MMDYKAMTTPTESNLKLFSDASLDSIDATMYCHIIDVPNEHKTKYFLFCEHLEPVPNRSYIKYQVSLYQGYGAERSSEALVCCDGRKNS